MTEPRIQYVKTSDDVSIAYCVLGEGQPLVHLPFLPISHLQGEWQLPEQRRWYERLAQTRMLIRYDSRGTGLSERRMSDLSLDARMLDLEAVVERLNLDRFALFGPLHTGPLAVAYAARHLPGVSRLQQRHQPRRYGLRRLSRQSCLRCVGRSRVPKVPLIRSPRSRHIRRVLIPLNFVLAIGMLISLTFGTPMELITAALVVTTAASIVAVLIER